MGSLSDITQAQWIAAFKRLGLVVREDYGAGSHIRVFGGNKKVSPLTIPNHTYKQMNRKIYKNLQQLGFTDEEINKALKLKG